MKRLLTLAFAAWLGLGCAAWRGATSWFDRGGISTAKPDPAQGLFEVSSTDMADFFAYAHGFYSPLPLRRFNDRNTFMDPKLSGYFRTESAYADYYANQTGALRYARFKRLRPLSVEIVEVRAEGPGKAAVVTRMHCKGLLVSWPANASNEGVVSYKVYFGTTAGSYSSARTVGATSLYLSGLTDGSTYYIAIAAIDEAGNESAKSSEINGAATNTTVPSPPGALTASDDLNGVVQLGWGATTTNTSATSGDPASPSIRDLAGYRVLPRHDRELQPRRHPARGGGGRRAGAGTLVHRRHGRELV